MRKKTACLLGLLLPMGHGSMDHAYQQGRSLGQGMTFQVPSSGDQNSLLSPKDQEKRSQVESELRSLDDGGLIYRTQQETRQNEDYQFILKNSRSPSPFNPLKNDKCVTLDENNPMFNVTKEVHKNPEAYLKTTVQDQPEEKEVYTPHTCQAPGEPYLKECERWLKIELTYHPAVKEKHFRCPGHRVTVGYLEFSDTVIDRIKKKAQKPLQSFGYGPRRWFGSGSVLFRHQDDDRDCNPYYSSFSNQYDKPIPYETIAKPAEVKEKEVWEDNCAALEQKVKDDSCGRFRLDCIEGGAYRPFTYVEVLETQGVKTRTNKTKTVHRPCWRQKLIYQCSMKGDSTCSILRSKGCYLSESHQKTCVRQEGDQCVMWQYTYLCLSQKAKPRRFKASNSTFYCLDGSCHDNTYDKNGDLGEAMANLSVLKEMEKDVQQSGANSPDQLMKVIHVFQGEKKSCTINRASMYDCCGTLEGWTNSLGFSRCSPEEKDLSDRKKKHLCVYVGQDDNHFLGFIHSSDTKVYCCFPNVLTRIVHEQGRKQLNLSWGTPQSPNCRGFTPDEVKRLDFSKINFSECFEEIKSKLQTPDPQAIQKRTKDNFSNTSKQLEELFQKRRAP